MGVVGVVVVPGYTGSYGLLGAFELVQLAALAQAWSLMAGYGGIVSLAVAAFVGVGSYGTAEVAAKAGWGLIPSVLAGGLVAVAFALVVAVPMLRFRGCTSPSARWCRPRRSHLHVQLQRVRRQ